MKIIPYKPGSTFKIVFTKIQHVFGWIIFNLLIEIQLWRLVPLQYKKNFDLSRTKLLVNVSLFPIILVTPCLKSAVLISTLFTQLMTFTTGASFDPKLQILHNVDLNSMNVSKIGNEYESQVNSTMLYFYFNYIFDLYLCLVGKYWLWFCFILNS